MSETRLVECDGAFCDPTRTHRGTDLPNEWVEAEFDDTIAHFCHECSWRMYQWATEGRTIGSVMQVRHTFLDDPHQKVSVMPAPDSDNTQSMTVMPYHDETDRITGFIPETMEGWHVHVFDHLGVTIIGKHKNDPLVVIDPEEFPTQVQLRETGSGYTFDTVKIEEGIEVERFEVDDS